MISDVYYCIFIDIGFVKEIRNKDKRLTDSNIILLHIESTVCFSVRETNCHTQRVTPENSQSTITNLFLITIVTVFS